MRQKLAGSSVFSTLLRVAEGKRVQATGPSGKKFWREISWSDTRWALQILAAKVLPDLRASEIDMTAKIEMTELPSDFEIGRRLLLVMNRLGMDKKPRDVTPKMPVVDNITTAAAPVAAPDNGAAAAPARRDFAAEPQG